jgi:hypothetical protein
MVSRSFQPFFRRFFMSPTSSAGFRRQVRQTLHFHRPSLTVLEDRTLLGDALLGALLGAFLAGPCQVLEGSASWGGNDGYFDKRWFSPESLSTTRATAEAGSAPASWPSSEAWFDPAAGQSEGATGTSVPEANPLVPFNDIPSALPGLLPIQVSLTEAEARGMKGLAGDISQATASSVGGSDIAARPALTGVPVQDTTRSKDLPPLPVPQPSSSAPAPTQAQEAQVRDRYAHLPASFEANLGQTDRRVQFLARGPGYNLFLTSTEAVLVANPAASAQPARADQGVAPAAPAAAFQPDTLVGADPAVPPSTVVRMQIVGGNVAVRAVGRGQLPGQVNYLVGNDPSRWQTHVPTYSSVEFQDVYPGINLVYHGNSSQLEYDFVVQPGADPNVIQLAFAGVDAQAIGPEGDLMLHTPGGTVSQQTPSLYQEVDGVQHSVAGTFVSRGPGQVAFQVGDYDHTRPLVIDPVLEYHSNFGGSSGAAGLAIAVDGAGSAYVTGLTGSVDFPTVNPFQQERHGSFDAFVTKLTPDGSGFVYSTYLGGSNLNDGQGIAVSSGGDAYVAGWTNSTDFPTAHALQPESGGGVDAFLTQFTPDGSALVYSTYLGGSGGDQAHAVALDQDGNAYVTGETRSSDFPTANALQPDFGGGTGPLPSDAFVAKIGFDAQTEMMSFVYSTYLGGSGNDLGRGIGVDGSGNAYVTGYTSSTDFLTTPGALQSTLRGSRNAFVTKLNAAGSALVYSTYLGGSGSEGYWPYGGAIAVDSAGYAVVTGDTESTDFPAYNAIQPDYGGGISDAFVTKFTPDGDLVFSSYLGSRRNEYGTGIAMDSAGNTYLTGGTPLSDDEIAFAAKLSSDGSGLTYYYYIADFNSYEWAYGIAVDAAGSAYVTGEAAAVYGPPRDHAYVIKLVGD